MIEKSYLLLLIGLSICFATVYEIESEMSILIPKKCKKNFRPCFFHVYGKRLAHRKEQNRTFYEIEHKQTIRNEKNKKITEKMKNNIDKCDEMM